MYVQLNGEMMNVSLASATTDIFMDDMKAALIDELNYIGVHEMTQMCRRHLCDD
jgi:hypothetical protein